MRPALGKPVLIAVAAAAILAGAGGAASPPRSFPFAPYADMSGSVAPDLATISRDSGVRHMTLGFVTAAGGKRCVPAWGGVTAYPAAGPGAYQLAAVRALRSAGGDIVVSFGGQAGVELARACPTVPALAAAYSRVIAAYGATHLDFDIEGAGLADRAANARRARAIARLQRGRTLHVSYTVPVLPTGLTAPGRALVRGARAAGAALETLNVMTMNYGDAAAPNPQGEMGAYAVQAATAAHAQLHAIYPRLDSAARWRRLGVTPMIGVNDVADEIFTLADAHQLAAFAKAHHIGMLAMWQLGRDRRCTKPVGGAEVDCSGIEQDPYDFARALGAFAG